jgi:hypothetical protein
MNAIFLLIPWSRMKKKIPASIFVYIFDVNFTGLRNKGQMKNAVFWDVTPCGSCKNRSIGGKQHLHHQGDKNR